MSVSNSLKRRALHRLRQVPTYADLAVRRLTASSRCLPNTIIVGAQKSGTTSLFSYLTQHPAIQGSCRKEVHYFDGGLDPRFDSYKRGEYWYRAHFPLKMKAASQNRIIEATPAYLFDPSVPERIASLIPNAKIIAVLRDPVERAISNFFHEVRVGREVRSIMQALNEEDDLLAPIWASGEYKVPDFITCSYKARGRYAEQIARYFEAFSREQVHVLSSKKLSKDTDDSLAKVFDFLGIDSTIHVTDKRPRNVSTNKPKIDSAVHEYLTDYFAPFNERLFELLEEKIEW